jgi:hypothetical protein
LNFLTLFQLFYKKTRNEHELKLVVNTTDDM